ncbi:ATP-dependent DNA helicase tlh2, partial [Fusarium odoratissimum]
FRSRRREAVEAIMTNESPVIAIMGTGTGNSFCFMLCAANCTRDGKAEKLKFWMGGTRREQYGDGRVIVTTNALGFGIDVPDIQAVVQVGMPYRMADYAKQSGRAGRDGQRSEAIVIRLDTQGSSRMPPPLISEHAATDSYNSSDVCRHVLLDSVMDGRNDRESFEDQEELFDVSQCRMGEGGQGG